MERLCEAVNRATERALFVVLSLMTVSLLCEVVFRYIAHLPLFWTEEAARYALVWASMLGAAVAVRRGGHIAVTFAVSQLSGRGREIAALLAEALVLGFSLTLLVGGVLLLGLSARQVSPAMRLPMTIPHAAVPVGAALMSLQAAGAMLGRLRGLRSGGGGVP